MRQLGTPVTGIVTHIAQQHAIDRTGALLAEGADGLHKLVSVFTNYMDSAAKKAKA